MGTAKATKAADKSQVCRKLVQALQKLYGKSVPKIDLPVLETMLFAACLEDNSWAPAEVGLKKMLASCFDLNEIRVSTVSELEQALAPLREADWKGLRIRSILRHIFETTYSYDFEKLRRQTLEQALKTLKKFHDFTPFIRDFVLHEILGSHIVVLDNSMLNTARWLGLVPVADNLHDASEFLKGGLKKSEVSEFCHLLRCLATDPKFIPRFADMPDHELHMNDVMDRFAELQLPPKKKPSKPVPPPVPPTTDKHPGTRKPTPVSASLSSSKSPATSVKPVAAPSKATPAAAKLVIQERPVQPGKLPVAKPPAATAVLPKPSAANAGVKPVSKSTPSGKPSKPAAVPKPAKTVTPKPVHSAAKKPAPPTPKAAAKKTPKKK